MRFTVTLRDEHDTVVETKENLTTEEAIRVASGFVLLHGADPDGLAGDAETPWAGRPGRISFTPVGAPGADDADLSPAAERFLFPERSA